MKSPLIRGLTAALAISGVLALVWWIWLGRLHSDNDLPTNSLDRLEQNGVPDFKLQRLFGGEFQLNQVVNKVIIVNFWASWCEPCAQEFPSMLRLVDHYQGRLELIAISADSNRQDAIQFAKLYHARRRGVELLWDPKRKIAKEFGTEKLPETYILSMGHRLVRKVLAVNDWDTRGVYDYMDTLLNISD